MLKVFTVSWRFWIGTIFRVMLYTFANITNLFFELEASAFTAAPKKFDAWQYFADNM